MEKWNNISKIKENMQGKLWNYRGITLFNVTYKVISGILNERMKTYAEQALKGSQSNSLTKEQYRPNIHYQKYDRKVS